MRNAKKTLSLVMIAIFTTFIVLSGIPAGAVTAAAAKAQVTKATTAVVKVEKTVKVSTFNVTTAQTQLTAANKEVSKVKTLGKTYAKTYTALAARTAAVNKKIAAKKLAIAKQAAALAKAYADANKAVEALEKAVDADNVDLVADAAALATAQGAVTAALEYIEKLDKNSSNYKGLMARVDMANTLISDAVAEVQEAEAAAEKEAAEKAAKEAAAKLEAEAQAAAETAVKAVEDAVAANDFVKADTARKEALVKVDAVKDVEKNAAFAARLAAAYTKTQPAIIKTVTAIDGTITVNFDKKPITTVAAVNFTVTKTVTTAAAVTTTVTPTGFTVVSDTAVTLTVPAVPASTTAQSVVYSVVYNATGAAIAAPAYAVDAIPALTATATATNLKEVVVTFNQTVTKASAETESYYTGITVGLAELQADGKTVILTVADGSELTSQTAYTLTIAGVVSATSALKPTVTAAFTALDLTLPTVESVKVTGPQSVTLTFSEPIENIGTAVLDDGVNYITVPTGAVNARTLTLTTGTSMTAGAHKLVLAGFTDYQGLKTVSQTFNFNVVADTTLPTVALTSVTQTEAVFTFSKPVTVGSAFTVYHSLNNSTNYVGVASLDGDGVTLTVDFSAHPMPAGTVIFYLNNSTDSTTATKDKWGNLFATTTVSGTVTADVTAPTYTVTVVNNTTLDVVFSEAVAAGAGTNGSELTTNYTVKDLSGTAATVSGAVLQSDNKTVRLTVSQLNGGSYVVTVANVADRNIVPNKMGSVAVTISVTDTVNPEISSIYFAGSTSASAAGKIVVKFNEAMNLAKLADKTNYVYIIGTTAHVLGSSDTVTVAADGKSVTIALAAVQFDGTTNEVMFGPLTDAAGNCLSDGGSPATIYPVGGFTMAATLDAVTVVSAKAISKTQIQVTLSQPVTSAVASDFVFTAVDGSLLTLTGNVASVTTNSSGQGVITFTLSASLTTDALFGGTPAAVYVETIATPTSETSVLGTKLSAYTTDGGMMVADKIAPAIATAVVTDASTITLTFSEALKDDTFAATLNGFSVSAGTLTSVTHDAGTKVVVLHSTEADFVVGSTVSYNVAAGLTDAATSVNALPSFTATTVAP